MMMFNQSPSHQGSKVGTAPSSVSGDADGMQSHSGQRSHSGPPSLTSANRPVNKMGADPLDRMSLGSMAESGTSPVSRDDSRNTSTPRPRGNRSGDALSTNQIGAIPRPRGHSPNLFRTEAPASRSPKLSPKLARRESPVVVRADQVTVRSGPSPGGHDDLMSFSLTPAHIDKVIGRTSSPSNVLGQSSPRTSGKTASMGLYSAATPTTTPTSGGAHVSADDLIKFSLSPSHFGVRKAVKSSTAQIPPSTATTSPTYRRTASTGDASVSTSSSGRTVPVPTRPVPGAITTPIDAHSTGSSGVVSRQRPSAQQPTPFSASPKVAGGNVHESSWEDFDRVANGLAKPSGTVSPSYDDFVSERTGVKPSPSAAARESRNPFETGFANSFTPFAPSTVSSHPPVSGSAPSTASASKHPEPPVSKHPEPRYEMIDDFVQPSSKRDRPVVQPGRSDDPSPASVRQIGRDPYYSVPKQAESSRSPVVSKEHGSASDRRTVKATGALHSPVSPSFVRAEPIYAVPDKARQYPPSPQTSPRRTGRGAAGSQSATPSSASRQMHLDLGGSDQPHIRSPGLDTPTIMSESASGVLKM